MKTLDALLTGATLLGVAACAALVLAEPLTISGPARVIDGDTVVVNGVHVRLKGVDSSERGTERGDSATAVMLEIVGNGDLSCRLTGEKTHRREVGYCFTADGVDIRRSSPWARRWRARAMTRAMSRSSRQVRVTAQPRSSYCARQHR